MNTWTLILLVHVGIWGKTDSNSLTNVQFATEQACISAGNKSSELVRDTKKEVRFICVRNN